MFTAQEIIVFLLQYKYTLLVPLVIIEGPVASIITGLLASLNVFSLSIALSIIVIGDIIGDIAYYGFGRFGGRTVLLYVCKVMNIDQKKLHSLELYFNKHGGKTIAMGKFSQGLGGGFCLAAGIAHFPFLRFFWYSLLVSIPKSLLLLVIGYYFGWSYLALEGREFWIFLLINILVLALVFFLIYTFINHEKH